MVVEQTARMSGVLAEHDVRLPQLREQTQRHVGEVADRRRADGEHRLSVERLDSCEHADRAERAEAGTDHAGCRPELRADEANAFARRRQRLTPHRRLGRAKQERPRGCESTADDDDIGPEDVDEAPDAGAEATTYAVQ